MMTSARLEILASTADHARNHACRAADRFPEFNSPHEGFGVLAEEVMELLAAIRLNDRSMIRAEAYDVAAVAIRMAAEL